MKLSELLTNAGVSFGIPEKMSELEVKTAENVCNFSFYPWLRATGEEIIRKIAPKRLISLRYCFSQRLQYCREGKHLHPCAFLHPISQHFQLLHAEIQRHAQNTAHGKPQQSLHCLLYMQAIEQLQNQSHAKAYAYQPHRGLIQSESHRHAHRCQQELLPFAPAFEV